MDINVFESCFRQISKVIIYCTKNTLFLFQSLTSYVTTLNLACHNDELIFDLMGTCLLLDAGPTVSSDLNLASRRMRLAHIKKIPKDLLDETYSDIITTSRTKLSRGESLQSLINNYEKAGLETHGSARSKRSNRKWQHIRCYSTILKRFSEKSEVIFIGFFLISSEVAWTFYFCSNFSWNSYRVMGILSGPLFFREYKKVFIFVERTVRKLGTAITGRLSKKRPLIKRGLIFASFLNDNCFKRVINYFPKLIAEIDFSLRSKNNFFCQKDWNLVSLSELIILGSFFPEFFLHNL